MAADRLAIRTADLESDKPGIVAALRRHLNPAADERRFEWLYRANPWGSGRSWLAVEAETGNVVGVCSAFPRRVYAGAESLEGWVLGDFCLAPEYRTVGPALRLQRACLNEMDGAGAAFCYDFPSAGMTAVYRRLGIEPQGQLVRLAKPLRVDRKLRSALGRGPARWLSGVGNASLALIDRRRRARSGADIGVHDGAYGVEFSALAARIRGGGGVRVQRTAEYLNWRYRGSPGHRHETLVARRGGVLCGYVVFAQEGEDATLVDLVGDDDRPVLEMLVHGAVDLLRVRGVMTLSAPVSAAHPLIDVLQSLGFRARERGPLVVYTGDRRGQDAATLDAAGWCLTHGDRDS